MKKIIFFIITVLTVTAVLFACAPKKETPENVDDSSSAIADTSAEEPLVEEGSLMRMPMRNG